MRTVQKSRIMLSEIVLEVFVSVEAFAQNPGDILRVTYQVEQEGSG